MPTSSIDCIRRRFPSGTAIIVMSKGVRRVFLAFLALLATLVSFGCGRNGSEQTGATKRGLTAIEFTRRTGCKHLDSMGLVSGVDWEIQCPKFDHAASISHGDLTGDGVADVVFSTPTGSRGKHSLTAVNSTNGQVLWVSRHTVETVTTVAFADLTGDGTADVIAGGRGFPDKRPILAVDGTNGSTLWQVDEVEPAWQNVYTPINLGDVTGDQVPDWLVSTGGDHVRLATEAPSVAGRLAVIDGERGEVNSILSLPDKEEIYSSPLLVRDAHGDRKIVVGSGGEAFPGSLWSISLSDLLHQDPSGFIRLDPGDRVSSYIAPPIAADLQADGDSEILTLRMDGLLEARDFSGNALWTTREPTAQRLATYGPGWAVSSVASPAIGQLDDDPSLEVVSLHTFVPVEQLKSGEPYTGDALLTVHDGATGQAEYELNVPHAYSVASPLILEVGGTGQVLCSCLEGRPRDADDISDPRPPDQPNPANIALWQPQTGALVDLAISSTVSVTPALIALPKSRVSLVTAGTIRKSDKMMLSISSRSISKQSYRVSILWGSYWGSFNNGHTAERP